MSTYLALPRYVRKDRRIYHFSDCRLCGACYGIATGEPCACRVTHCLACNTPQCMSNGLAGGTCAICLHGLLDGWSGSCGRTCHYKGCSAPAVARGRGRKPVCLPHLIRPRPDFPAAWQVNRDANFFLTKPTEVPYR